MGSVGLKTTSQTNVVGLVSDLAAYDSRYSDDVVRAAQAVHDDFPELEEIFTVKAEDLDYDTLASMNGLGFLSINRRILHNYDATTADLIRKSYWLAGKSDFEHAIAMHELAHNADHAFMRYISAHAPNGTDTDNVTIASQNWADAYSYALGKQYNVGDTVAQPSVDYDAKFISMGGNKYSMHDFNDGVSDVVVPLAIQNIQNNWQKLGYSYRPSVSQIAHDLSGYAGQSYDTGRNANKEIFAESYSNYRSYGKSGNVLAQEVMRLTNQAYRSIGRRPKNDEYVMFDRIHEFTKKRKEAKNNGK